MLAFDAIIEAVSDLLKERYPDAVCYMNRVPDKFVRPSFLVCLGPTAISDADCNCLELSVTVVVVAFVTADDYHNSHVPDLVRRLAGVQELFAVGGIQVGDRVLHMKSNTGECQFDYAEATVTFNYLDDRPGGEDWPLMGEINTKTEVKEG